MKISPPCHPHPLPHNHHQTHHSSSASRTKRTKKIATDDATLPLLKSVSTVEQDINPKEQTLNQAMSNAATSNATPDQSSYQLPDDLTQGQTAAPYQIESSYEIDQASTQYFFNSDDGESRFGGSSQIWQILGGVVLLGLAIWGISQLADDVGDEVEGSNGNDLLIGTEGDDSLFGYSGDDILEGGKGDDSIDGGSGNDTARYLGFSQNGQVTQGVDVDLNDSDDWQDTKGAGDDYLESIENLVGTIFADTLTGNDDSNILSGAAGNDIINGDGGNDRLFGGEGQDTLISGGGRDTFAFDYLDGLVDTLDFSGNAANTQSFSFDDTIFKSLSNDSTGTLRSGQFYKAAGATTALDSDDFIILDSTTGKLYYDADGVGGSASVQFADILDSSTSNMASMTQTQFIVL